nr:SPX and EXS domain-containing protein 5-like isoform X2 [Physcomitrium patens]|eukprot:XP_024384774.1 SPX and EXS domain-containing protein 5-like isoform X2 [Physcomitrella patens]
MKGNAPSTWGMQAISFAVWILICLKVAYESLTLMNVTTLDKFLYEVYLYYNPVFLMSAMVWLWGVDVWVFLTARFPYARVFELDPNHITHHEIWKIATWMTVAVITSMTAYLYLYSHGMVSMAASQPVLLYVTVPLVLGLPLDMFYMNTRFFFLKTLVRLTFPVQVLSDVERSVCRMYHRQVATVAWLTAKDTCGGHSMYIPIVLAYPYLSRLLQCLRQYHDTKDKTCLFNALKYTTTFPVIFLSALKYHVELQFWFSTLCPLWVLCAILNSGYSFWWDVTKDWDLGWMKGPWKPVKQSLRPTLMFNRPWVYYWAIGSNMVLRAAWTYKLSAHLRHNFKTVFLFSFLEMLRRFQWIFFRVEVAALRLSSNTSSSSSSLSRVTSIPLKDIVSETEHLLSGSNHNV